MSELSGRAAAALRAPGPVDSTDAEGEKCVKVLKGVIKQKQDIMKDKYKCDKRRIEVYPEK
jgi:hypothetical protein